jgi:SAM-dependent methyltransferase
VNVQRLQESSYGADVDYRVGSPHLTHYKLADRLHILLKRALEETISRRLPAEVLEVGAGDGAFTEAILAAGYAVTATEVSAASVDRMERRFAHNSRFKAVHDPGGSLGDLGEDAYSAIVCVSVLHHIPDYLSFTKHAIDKHLVPGGSFITIQDPIWYPSVGRFTRLVSQVAYYCWRSTKGNYGQGFQTVLRRLRRVYDDTKPGDVVEYHVVRKGVNHQALLKMLESHFTIVNIFAYWSTQSAIWQWLGEKLRLSNTFAIDAQGYRPRIT